MRNSYLPQDVTLLLKDLSGALVPLSAKERERAIQSGTHYAELLPLEYAPSAAYQDTYQSALQNYAKETAKAICHVSELVYQRKGRDIVLVSLARAGIPIGILMKRYLEKAYGMEVPHYAVSIIRGKGMDQNAMQFLLQKHKAQSLQFVDGWTGKGAILYQLEEALAEYKEVSAELAVVADPANLTDLCGTHEDILIPSSCLNCTVSGLVSRTVYRNDLIGPNDFHGAVYYGELSDQDVSYEFIHAVESEFVTAKASILLRRAVSGLEEVKSLADHFGIADINLLKPGIGETTRVLLRRVPWKVLIRPENKHDPRLEHLYQLAEEKKVPIEYYALTNYTCCGIIKRLADA